MSQDLLPKTEIINGPKKIFNLTLKEFYDDFIKNIIDIIYSIKSNDTIYNTFFIENRPTHIGVIFIILSILVLPLI